MTHDLPTVITSGEYERPPRPTELALLDIDRTLIKTRRLFEMALDSMVGKIEDLTPKLKEELLQAEIGEVGNAFDYIDWLYIYTNDEQLLDPQAIKDMIVRANCDEDGRISDEFIEEIMIDGSLDLFEALEETNTAAVLLTAGGKINQMVKVLLLQQIVRQQAEDTGRQLANLDSYIIIDNSKQRKTELASECSDEDGNFSIHPLLAHASAYGDIDADTLTDVETTWVFDDKFKNTTPTVNVNVTGVLMYIEGDPKRYETGENKDAPYHRIGLRDAAAMLRDRKRASDSSLN